MARHRAVYVRDEDESLWQRAVAYAKRNRMTISGLILLALERFLDENEDPPRR